MFKQTGSISFVVGYEVIQGEALGFLHALFGALQLGLLSVIFELDCKLVVDWVLTGIDDVSKSGVKFWQSASLFSFPNATLRSSLLDDKPM